MMQLELYNGELLVLQSRIRDEATYDFLCMFVSRLQMLILAFDLTSHFHKILLKTSM